MKIRASLFVALLALTVACGTPTPPAIPTAVSLPPAPTADAAATEQAITQKIFATLTASAPQAPTVTPPPLGTATPENTPLPTLPPPTLSTQLSPSVTPIPELPTRVPTRAAAAASPESTQAQVLNSTAGLTGKILFKSIRAQDPKKPKAFDWYVMDADGSNVQKVEKEAAAALYDQQQGGAGLSPDHSLLVVGERVCGGGKCDLYIGPPEQVIARSQGQWTSGPKFAHADQPVWSPDGNWVAFTWNLDNERTKNLYKGNPYAQNQDFKRLTDFGGQPDLKNPTYSPDGTKLVFASNSQGNRWQIWVLDALAENFVDANPHPLVATEFDDFDPVWIK